jgi:hypothetical protein
MRRVAQERGVYAASPFDLSEGLMNAEGLGNFARRSGVNAALLPITLLDRQF